MSTSAQTDSPRAEEPVEALAIEDAANASPYDGLARELAAIQEQADLDAAKRAAAVLTAKGLKGLRDWIDSRLRESKETEVDPGLSERECEVVRLIALGYSNKEIAARLKVSVKTVETYKSRSMEKLKLRNRVSLVRYAISRGWLTDLDEPLHTSEQTPHGS